MRVEQISIFLENKVGRLSEVTSVLAEAGVDIRALSLADTSDFGVLRLIVNDTQKAKQALKNNGFTVGKTDVAAVEVEDKPGGLHNILDLLNKNDMNVEYMYAFVHQDADNAVMIFKFDHIDEAVELLTKNGIAVISGSKIHKL
jgi:hypothetical protein